MSDKADPEKNSQPDDPDKYPLNYLIGLEINFDGTLREITDAWIKNAHHSIFEDDNGLYPEVIIETEHLICTVKAEDFNYGVAGITPKNSHFKSTDFLPEYIVPTKDTTDGFIRYQAISNGLAETSITTCKITFERNYKRDFLQTKKKAASAVEDARNQRKRAEVAAKDATNQKRKAETAAEEARNQKEKAEAATEVAKTQKTKAIKAAQKARNLKKELKDFHAIFASIKAREGFDSMINGMGVVIATGVSLMNSSRNPYPFITLLMHAHPDRLKNKEIADILGRSESAVSRDLKKAKERLGLGDLKNVSVDRLIEELSEYRYFEEHPPAGDLDLGEFTSDEMT